MQKPSNTDTIISGAVYRFDVSRPKLGLCEVDESAFADGGGTGGVGIGVGCCMCPWEPCGATDNAELLLFTKGERWGEKRSTEAK